MDLDIEHLRGWIGKTETMTERLTPNLVTRFNATLDRNAPADAGAEAPLMMHFCLAQPVARQAGLAMMVTRGAVVSCRRCPFPDTCGLAARSPSSPR